LLKAFLVIHTIGAQYVIGAFEICQQITPRTFDNETWTHTHTNNRCKFKNRCEESSTAFKMHMLMKNRRITLQLDWVWTFANYCQPEYYT